MMNSQIYEVIETDTYSKWFKKIRSWETKTTIVERIVRIQTLGHFGDHKDLKDGLWELRFANGIRIYYTVRSSVLIFLVIGGDKSSQKRDIAKAKKLMKELK